MDRKEIGTLIAKRINQQAHACRDEWQTSAPINVFTVDDLLPESLAREIRQAFPDASAMMLRKSIRELKYVSSQMNQHEALLEEVIFAFQEPDVVREIANICCIPSLYPDEHLYAGGISLMGPGHFLNPHLDNSHDKDRERYRVLNLLYYVSPDWTEQHGGNLEVWPNGISGQQKTIVSRFNRLAVMVTNQHSWHSVSRNVSDQLRCCVSNYYFSDHPLGDKEYFHPTSFRGRPEQPIRDVALRLDATARGLVRKVFPNGVRKAKHVYKKD
ncbi:2OG-Fe(II) oxygenase [Burkholderia cenocepacia]|uniref:2OG-Fe(II) oxygenase n=1 Tax=Burkholderia cenocepacia TaxID=95486 RepID=UPI00223006ED|nr:2OG-Fe(II) oxygenase [Burkholderia cenocepacia]MCW3539348.1 2OG-Fe(II) oxygenase [Burkholderia cenocepacia]